MPTGFEAVAEGDGRNRLHFDLEGFASAAGLEGPKGANWFVVAPAANATSGGNGTTTPTTPPPEQYENSARKNTVAASIFGAVVAGVAVMML